MTKSPKFSAYIAGLIDRSTKTQKEIASDLGYDRPNLITMFKQGATRVPIEKVPLLAKSLGIDPAFLLHKALLEYMPTTLATIQSVMGYTVTAHEFEIIEVVRTASKQPNPKMSREQAAAIRKLFS